MLLSDLAADGDSEADVLERLADASSPELEAVWEREWAENLQAAALERLQRQVKAKHYQVYVLHVIQGKPLREVCRVLGVNGATVYVLKHRLTRLLREIVRKLERDLS
jgi:RNA polymerase sigma-70 factor (ECF subfamily)